jgi:hypothetical protein
MRAVAASRCISVPLYGWSGQVSTDEAVKIGAISVLLARLWPEVVPQKRGGETAPSRSGVIENAMFSLPCRDGEFAL